MPKLDIYLSGTLVHYDLSQEVITVRIELDISGEINEETEDSVFKVIREVSDQFERLEGTSLVLEHWIESGGDESSALE